MVTTIQIDEKVKSKLDKLKVHYRESYNELISRIISESPDKDVDKESLQETVEVLSSPETMRIIAETLERIGQGDYGTDFEDIKKELNLKD